MFRPFAAFGGGVFEQHYRCYPVSFIEKLDAEDGDKVFLPPSALDRLGKLCLPAAACLSDDLQKLLCIRVEHLTHVRASLSPFPLTCLALCVPTSSSSREVERSTICNQIHEHLRSVEPGS